MQSKRNKNVQSVHVMYRIHNMFVEYTHYIHKHNVVKKIDHIVVYHDIPQTFNKILYLIKWPS